MENEKEETLNENNDSTNVEEVVETEEVETDNTPTLEDYEALKQKNKELYERAKKAEALAKAKREAPLTKEIKNTEEDLIRTARLASQLDDDDLEMLTSLNGTLTEKINNPLFKAYKENKARKLKSESASIKPSGSGSVSTPKADMTPEEHKEWFKKVMAG